MEYLLDCGVSNRGSDAQPTARGRQGGPHMRVLVTGDRGTSELFWCRGSSSTDTRSSGSTPDGTTAATSVDGPSAAPRPATSAMSRLPTLRASTPWSTSPRSPTTRSGTSTRGDLLGQRRRGRHLAGRPRPPASSGSCSPRRARSTARPGDAPVDEDAAFNPVTPYGESKVMAEAGLAALADDTSARPTCATPRRTAPRPGCGRHRGQQPDRHGVHPGEVRLQSDGSRGGRWCTSRTSPAPSWPPSRRRATRPRPGLQRRPRRGRRADPRHRHAWPRHWTRR